ncbi:GIY-YIG nuclease family protein [Mediterraneibacter sp. NSJ-55]|uniref:GIY-YIG nuclease family protein n=2 Tax=Mediterraneibacter hominis TaxID=2763054 RepID=A0A923LG05_9FIRM|nr:GIY-YIG nuclease family protein [Mediterraneibacter hominis]
MTMAISKKLEMIYHNGQPDGIRSIRRNLSTMTTYVIPRPLLSEAKNISGINRPGIYYLINEDDGNKIVQLYIGQTRNGIARLDDHNRSKDFWNKAIMFLAESKTFTLDMISGLEKFAIIKAQESKRYKVENNIVPKYEIDEYDLAAVEEIYDEIQFIMATQGYKMNDAKSTINEVDILHTTRNGITAFGIYDGEKFEVLEDSQINIEKPARLQRYNRQRAELLSQQSIVDVDGKYILKVTLDFKTPSGASDFVLGGSTNGWVEWKNKDGKTLDELYRK